MVAERGEALDGVEGRRRGAGMPEAKPGARMVRFLIGLGLGLGLAFAFRVGVPLSDERGAEVVSSGRVSLSLTVASDGALREGAVVASTTPPSEPRRIQPVSGSATVSAVLVVVTAISLVACSSTELSRKCESSVDCLRRSVRLLGDARVGEETRGGDEADGRAVGEAVEERRTGEEVADRDDPLLAVVLVCVVAVAARGALSIFLNIAMGFLGRVRVGAGATMDFTAGTAV